MIVPSNMKKYTEVSDIIKGVLRDYDPNFSSTSLDEAYLDITNFVTAKNNNVSIFSLVEELRSRIFEVTGLTASAGIAPNCMLAKVCSDMNKPNGQYQLNPNSKDILEFVSNLNIRKIGGIGNHQNSF